MFTVVKTKKEAEELVLEWNRTKKTAKTNATASATSGSSEGENTEIITLPLIIKSDATGSIEGIIHEISKISHARVALKIASQGIGDITEADIKAVQGLPNTIVLGFNVSIDPKATAILERNPMNVKTFKVIYELVEYVRSHFTALIPKEKVTEILGSAKIMAIFSANKDKQIVGGKVQKDAITVGSDVRILRRDEEIGVGRITGLQQQKEKASEVREGYEFGAMIDAKVEIAAGDKIEAFRIVEK
jgi:translation initiation factor IF-2